ncbi:GNAT family N-acetyltransferase [Geothermobacter hydrogeniphilus]|uniref:GNAT family N-acetyltransferase n=2 Tax=Geothermobacter hydrogeniphilus TaxID=1969733 RepID=A0A2K2H6S8_9BACT|nr:GNAT family N-acetyltransferase [Geothermobacter hydrogeniphilus]
MNIQTATRDDIPSLCRLLDHLFAQEAEFRPDRAAQQRGLEMIISDPALGSILVARREGEVIGMVNLLYTVSTALGQKVALLEDMVVLPGQRDGGTGSRLLRAALDHAAAQGCARITLLTDADNEAAQRFYRRHGFSLSPMVPLRLPL